MKRFGLKFFTGSEFFLFLFFLLVSCCLWLMLTLNQDYEAEIDVPLHIKQIPDNVGFSGSGEEVITLKVRDRGTTLMNYMFASFLPITVDYAELRNRRGRLTLSVSSLKKRIEGQLQSSTNLISVHPDTFMYYTRESAVRVPVNFIGNYSVAKQYVAGAPILVPDSVWVYAPMQVADTLRSLATVSLDYGELRDSLRADVALHVPQGIKCVPEKLALTIPVSPYAEKIFELPIKALDFPENFSLKTFPSSVRVFINVNMSQYETVGENDFEIGVYYSEIADGSKARAKLHLIKRPSVGKDIKIVPDEVEYLIEHNE